MIAFNSGEVSILPGKPRTLSSGCTESFFFLIFRQTHFKFNVTQDCFVHVSLYDLI